MSFTKQFTTGNRTFNCCFVKAYTSLGIKYYITVSGAEAKSSLLVMEQSGSHWKIVGAPDLPYWAQAIEPLLEQAIPD